MGLFLLILLLGYLLGSTPSGYLAGRWCKGIDLRDLGSGSTGATNVLRQVGGKTVQLPPGEQPREKLCKDKDAGIPHVRVLVC